MIQIFKLIIVLNLMFYSAKGLAQTIRPTNNDGGYTIEHFENNILKKLDSIVIFGNVFSLSDNKNIGAAAVIFGCTKKEIIGNGSYKFRTSSNDLKTNYLVAKGLGHKAIETEFFPLKPGDSIRIDFYLSEDNRPIMNCIE